MADYLTLRCPACMAAYRLPDTFDSALAGSAVCCTDCQRWWVPVRATEGPPIRLVDGRPRRDPMSLEPYRIAASPPAERVAAARVDNEVGSGTVKVPLATAQASIAAVPTLRVVVDGPAGELKGVFDIEGKIFWIGREGCHLNLPQAAMAKRLIGIRPEPGSLLVEGIDGFVLPTATPASTARLAGDQRLMLEMPPYRIQLGASATPGSAIADLTPPAAAAAAAASVASEPVIEEPPAVDSPVAEPSAEPPAGPPPAAPAPAPQPPASQAPVSRPPQPPPVATGGDLREIVQSVAADVDDRPDFERRRADLEALEGDQTVTDLSARGFLASRYANPLAGLDLTLVYMEGPARGRVFKISKSPLLIGRTDGDLVIADKRVSSKHAQLEIAGPRMYTLKDLASTNGTTVNDRPVSIAQLRDGDKIGFGGVKFELRAKIPGK